MGFQGPVLFRNSRLDGKKARENREFVRFSEFRQRGPPPKWFQAGCGGRIRLSRSARETYTNCRTGFAANGPENTENWLQCAKTPRLARGIVGPNARSRVRKL